MTKPFLLFIGFFVYFHSAIAQKIVINTSTELYELNGGPGNCSVGTPINYCSNNSDGRIFSTALHNDTLYFITGLGTDLYRTVLGKPETCEFLTWLPYSTFAYNSLTVDLYGNVYGINLQGILFRYQKGQAKPEVLGILPRSPGGDMLYYKDQLFYTTDVGEIYLINIDKPSSSTLYMSVPGYTFIGLISFPADCNKNKIYGITGDYPSSRLVELDFENKTSLGVVCTLPFQAYDAASVVEDGKTAGITLDSITVIPPCEGTNLLASINIHAFTATSGGLSYTLDGSKSNATGTFTDLTLGTHTIHITNQRGCLKDTIVDIKKGLSSQFNINKTSPLNCTTHNGIIEILNATSGYSPLTYSLNDSPFVSTNSFTGLGGGIFPLVVKDAAGCMQDTIITLPYANTNDVINTISVLPSLCGSKTGKIDIILNSFVTDFETSIDNKPKRKILKYEQLLPGEYLISVFRGLDCKYDTIVNIPEIKEDKPLIILKTTDPGCNENNGEINVEVMDRSQPWSIIYNGQEINNREYPFTGLDAGDHTFKISDQNLCSWDTTWRLNRIPLETVTYNVTKKDPSCKALNSGEATINVFGTGTSYQILYNNNLFSAGQLITGLPAGKNIFQIINNRGCLMETVEIPLVVIEEPECDRFFMPNAFTPNNDGINDMIKPVHSPYLKNIDFTIFNRYGQIVYRYKGSGNGWDGNFGGKLQPSGTYAWRASYTTFKNTHESHFGTIMLIR